jgi:hypothetical protein
VDGAVSATVRRSAGGGALAVSAELLATDAGLREEVIRVSKGGTTEVVVWGEHWPAELGRQADAIRHRVSTAARAFKSQALMAADVSADAVGMTEEVFWIGNGSLRSLYSV